ncbi:Putative membrane protein [Amycolatopsis japonica]|uniref:Putative membrane protein n=1 Tax=Amycolatopsis japonica TaxID=208439 RepID=A0A075UQB2_9PSEU|nr:Putative membrane protein [Amycolatopsis japonica]
MVEGRQTTPATFDHPLVTSGSRLNDGGVVVEHGFAGAGAGLTLSVAAIATIPAAFDAHVPVTPVLKAETA